MITDTSKKGLESLIIPLVHKQFIENESFRRFVGDMVCAITSQ